MLIFLKILFLLKIFHTSAGYIETVIISGCSTCKLQLTCRPFTSIIAIIEADFVKDEIVRNNPNNTFFINPTSFPPIHPRQALNQRCSGINYCTFILAEDCPGARTWGPGMLTVKYACVPDQRVRKYCNSEIVLPSNPNAGLSEGFILNPGYPRFYSVERQCRWKIRATYQEQILITLLDIALIADNAIFPEQCTDRLDVIDSGQMIYSTCQSQEPPLQILSSSDTIELVLHSSHFLTPLRGILVHYAAVGCPTPESPEDAYLVYRNDSMAEYRCCVGFVFPTGLKTLIINCLGAAWDTQLPLPDCHRISQAAPRNIRKLRRSEMASDLIAPALLIVALFLINFIVLFYIHRAKKKNALLIFDEEMALRGRRSVVTTDPAQAAPTTPKSSKKGQEYESSRL